MTDAPSMKMAELDAWYKEYENTLDDLRLVSWASLSHAAKLVLYLAWKKTADEEQQRSGQSARAYHRQPTVIQYFKENKLLHESGDYRDKK